MAFSSGSGSRCDVHNGSQNLLLFVGEKVVTFVPRRSCIQRLDAMHGHLAIQQDGFAQQHAIGVNLQHIYGCGHRISTELDHGIRVYFCETTEQISYGHRPTFQRQRGNRAIKTPAAYER